MEEKKQGNSMMMWIILGLLVLSGALIGGYALKVSTNKPKVEKNDFNFDGEVPVKKAETPQTIPAELFDSGNYVRYKTGGKTGQQQAPRSSKPAGQGQ
jgi:hypothetical protein